MLKFEGDKVKDKNTLKGLRKNNCETFVPL